MILRDVRLLLSEEEVLNGKLTVGRQKPRRGPRLNIVKYEDTYLSF